MTTLTKQTRCAIYCRLSVERPDQELSSVQIQRERCEAYAASQGWGVLPTDYSDDGFSGATANRPALQRLLSDVDAGHLDRVVTVRIDRISRSMLDFLNIMKRLDQRGVALVSVTQEINTATAWGKMVLNILAGFAQFERDLISERTRDKMAAARRKGRWTGGRPILGFDLAPEGGGLRVNERERMIVQGLFALFLDLGSLRRVAEEANRRGWRQKEWTTKAGVRRGGSPFDKGAVHRLLTNVLYIGKVRSNGDVHDGQHEVIVDLVVWDEVARRLRSNGHKRATRSGNSEAWLRGLLWCGNCGVPMTHTFTSKGARRYRFYTCRSAQRNGWHTCPIKSVSAGNVEAAVLDEIRASVQRDTDLLHATICEVHRQRKERTKDLRREIKIATLDRDSANGSSADAARRLVRLESQLAALSSVQISDGDVAETMSEWEPIWGALRHAEQAQIAVLIIERVVYDGEAVEITFRESANARE
jgi:site-specific DNA recombinase